MTYSKTVETPTGQLRWLANVLQQQIKVTIYDAGGFVEQRIEWRDVPEVDSE